MTEHKVPGGLSPRLAAIAQLVTRGTSAADIGTDHAYLPIALVSEGICPRAVASDISPAAAAGAADHVSQAGLSERIAVCVRDGLNGYEKGKEDTLVISGMGGPLIISILESERDIAGSFKEMILSPQSEVASVRRWLFYNGYCLTNERIVRDGKHDYFIMKARIGEEKSYAQDAAARAAGFLYGPILLRRKDPVLTSFVRREISRLDKAAQEILSSGQDLSGRRLERLKALETEKEAACTALMLLTT